MLSATERVIALEARRREDLSPKSLYDPKYCLDLIEFSRKPEGSFRAFAAKLFISPATLAKWAEDHSEFAYAKSVARTVNEQAMLDLGLKGMNGRNGSGSWQTAWIFTMKARHGWREDGAVDDDGEDTSMEFDHSGED